MQHPLIHLNGSPGKCLAEEYLGAVDAIDAAIEAMRRIDVNGRDYYPLGDGAFGIAAREHRVRMACLETIRGELAAIAENILDQLDAKAGPPALSKFDAAAALADAARAEEAARPEKTATQPDLPLSCPRL